MRHIAAGATGCEPKPYVRCPRSLTDVRFPRAHHLAMSYTVICFLGAVVAVVLGYGAIAAVLAGFAKLLFVLGSAARLRAANIGANEML